MANIPITIRVSQEEKERLEIASAMAGISVSEFVRRKLFHDSQGSREENEFIPDILDRLQTMEHNSRNTKFLMIYLAGQLFKETDFIRMKNFDDPAELIHLLEPRAVQVLKTIFPDDII